ncbi:hypothetical protein N0V90_012964 [Kalmusia sp. IMI 367209]|nr:hypothetical protein N0V90_012964 [Kalmusia sp. IMI 367209]
MPRKRTYSRENMVFAPSEIDVFASDLVNTGKRRKRTPPESGPPLHRSDASSALNGDGSPLNRGQRRAAEKEQAVQERLGKKFSGPVSMPNHDVDINEAPKKKDPFEAALDIAKARPHLRQQRETDNGARATLNPYMRTYRQNMRDLAVKHAQAHGSLQLVPSTGASEVEDLYVNDMDISSEGTQAAVLVDCNDRGGRESAAEVSARIFDGREYIPPKTSPPRKTLYENKIYEGSRQAILWTANQTDSPLLRLPSSIRQCIYDYALGGNTIELGYVTYSNLDMPNGTRSSLPAFQYCSIVYEGRYNPFTIHAQQLSHMSAMVLLNRVCRQLYLETYTLPYSLNHFCFDSENVLFNFIVMENRLTRQQRNAITAITIQHQLPVPILLKKLPNLERVRLMNSEKDYEQGWWTVDRTGNVPILKKDLARCRGQHRSGFYKYNRK